MKLVMIEGRGVGCQIGDDVLDFSRSADVFPEAASLPDSVAEMVDEARGALSKARKIVEQVEAASVDTLERLRSSGVLVPMRDIKLAAPLPRPFNLFLHGMAYHSHAKDWDSNARPAAPSHPPAGFHKSIASITGPDQPIVIPKHAPDNVDFEGEICVVFGRECHNVGREEAMDYVVGFTILNDVSARDWIPMIKAKDAPPIPTYYSLNSMYKNFPTFCPMGPNVTTKDEIGDFHDLRLITRLNSEVMQEATISELIWDIPELIERYSAVNRFMPGDVMSTGTPGGVGAGRNPPRFMRPGDVVSIEVPGVGTLTNPVSSSI